MPFTQFRAYGEQLRHIPHYQETHYRVPPKRPRLKKWLGRLGFAALTVFLIGVIFFVAAVAWYSKDLPDSNKLLDRNVAQSTKIFDRTGKTLLYDVHGAEKRTLIMINEIPDIVKQATISAEDKYFYQHKGFNLPAMIKGIVIDPLMGKRIRGGSTLTQQLVKNAILTGERTISRKIKELILAYRIERLFTKDQILQMYLNEIPYGSVSYGIQSAAQTYFGKNAKDLSLAESAILAAIPQAPTRYSPYGNNKALLLERQKYVLEQMVSNGYITREQADIASKTDVKFIKKQEPIIAPHFVMYVKELLSEKFGDEIVESGGLKVTTTLDLDKQKMAEEAVTAGVKKRGAQFKFNNAALVSLDPKNGQVLAMVGSKDYFGKSEPAGCISGKNCTFEPNDNVTLRLRQPGSSIKPMVYAAAFQKGYTPNTILYDVDTIFKTDFKDFHPQNYDFSEHGPLPMRQTLAGSLNIPAVKTLYLVGVQKTLDFLELMGYTSFSDRSRFGLSLVLGGGEVKMIEHASAFGVFADQGQYHKPTGILKVENSKGEVLLDFENNPRQLIDANLANIISNILSDNNARAFIFGTQNNLVLAGRPVAAKTGTTNEFKDAWTMGYTPSLVTAVWVGNNDSSPMKTGADGSVIAAPIWNEYMRKALANTPVENFPPAKIDATGKAVLDGIPAEEKIVKIDKFTQKLATDLTPLTFVEEKTFKKVHCILQYVYKDDPRGPYPNNPMQADPAYASWEAGVQAWLQREAEKNGTGLIIDAEPPTEFDDVHVEANRPSIRIISPMNGATINNNFLDAQVSPSAPRGIARVEYYLDNKLIATVTTAPFNLRYFMSSFFVKGYHNLRAVAYDDVDNSNETNVDVNIMVDLAPPTVNLISPTNGSVFNLTSFPVPVGVELRDLFATDSIDFFQQKVGSNNVEKFSTVIIPQKQFTYVNWPQVDSPGEYELYAEITSGGQHYQSNKIKIFAR